MNTTLMKITNSMLIFSLLGYLHILLICLFVCFHMNHWISGGIMVIGPWLLTIMIMMYLYELNGKHIAIMVIKKQNFRDSGEMEND